MKKVNRFVPQVDFTHAEGSDSLTRIDGGIYMDPKVMTMEPLSIPYSYTRHSHNYGFRMDVNSL